MAQASQSEVFFTKIMFLIWFSHTTEQVIKWFSATTRAWYGSYFHLYFKQNFRSWMSTKSTKNHDTHAIV